MKLGFFNIIGTITALSTTILAVLTSIGCSPGATDFAATCVIPWLPAQWVAIVAMAFGTLTFVSKFFRPGGVIPSMLGQTAVVSESGIAGTATSAQVAAGPPK
jgi:hypothetical protein